MPGNADSSISYHPPSTIHHPPSGIFQHNPTSDLYGCMQYHRLGPQSPTPRMIITCCPHPTILHSLRIAYSPLSYFPVNNPVNNPAIIPYPVHTPPVYCLPRISTIPPFFRLLPHFCDFLPFPPFNRTITCYIKTHEQHSTIHSPPRSHRILPA